ncbi:DUF1090 domain-containing protein [Vibrio salinus]|uniref:DUF1090 domain-containing protein n=1 Tax=Vibrio salinus TaxID=2899784 RepID=UPI001E535DB6|nr:DUF1090 domain-containing protein [Vibrio salinus]MCE0495651.1 DUF1090 domain-containing protein [Vibrio salinus]
MTMQDRIDSLERQIFIACSEGDYQRVNRLEKQLDNIREQLGHPRENDPFAPEGSPYIDVDDDWR